MTTSTIQASEIENYFERRLGDVITLTRALVEQESPSGDGEGSRAVVSLIENAARELGGVSSFERIVASDGYGEHLRLRAFEGEQSAPGILIIGHTDTVHPRGSLTSRPWREEAGKIYGPGIFDMKANCALVLEALRACEANDIKPKRPVTVLLTCDEESGSACGGRELVEEEARRAEYVLVLEPPAAGGSVKTARKGTGQYLLKLEGRAAHAGLEPEKGASAVLELARQIIYLHELNDVARGTTVSVGVVSGGTHSNVVPAEASCEIDVRFSTLDEAKRIDGLIRERKAHDTRVKILVDGGINRPPLERSAGVARAYERARECASALGFDLGEASVGGASDGNFAAAVGATVLDGLGVEGDGAHAEHEHIERAGIARRGALLTLLLASL